MCRSVEAYMSVRLFLDLVFIFTDDATFSNFSKHKYYHGISTFDTYTMVSMFIFLFLMFVYLPLSNPFCLYVTVETSLYFW